jgi:uracil-DNA glycosylase
MVGAQPNVLTDSLVDDMPDRWHPQLAVEIAKPYWLQLQHFVHSEREQHAVFPPADQVFAALQLTPFNDVRVVILGQDPYHGESQAHGLAFSVQDGVAIPPSLRNIFKELHHDLGIEPSPSGNLQHWAQQGVLLLNTTLTVRSGMAGSHHGRGWEIFTDAIISLLDSRAEPIVFVLWGAHAQEKQSLIQSVRHTVITSSHPSPLSAHRGFLGSRPFSAINSALINHGSTAIDWQLPNHTNRA